MDANDVFRLERANGRTCPSLSQDRPVDVVGAGMAGRHCAWAHGNQGPRVIILVVRRIGRQAPPHESERLALRREASAETVALSAICTHLPCHGSRFDEDAAVLAGPAPQPRVFGEIAKAER